MKSIIFEIVYQKLNLYYLSISFYRSININLNEKFVLDLCLYFGKIIYSTEQE